MENRVNTSTKFIIFSKYKNSFNNVFSIPFNEIGKVLLKNTESVNKNQKKSVNSSQNS